MAFKKVPEQTAQLQWMGLNAIFQTKHIYLYLTCVSQ